MVTEKPKKKKWKKKDDDDFMKIDMTKKLKEIRSIRRIT